MDHVVLLSPSANRVYAGENARLSAAELSIMLGSDTLIAEPVQIAGVDYLRLDRDTLDDTAHEALGNLSSRLAVFRREGEALYPVAIDDRARFDDDLLTIPKYPGKTNELFTRLLLNVTAGSARRPLHADHGDVVVLDPMCGRGTTLSAAWLRGFDAAGVDADAKAVESYATFLRTYLRRKRLKHTVGTTVVRREGRSIGRRLDCSVTPGTGGAELSSTVFTGDTRDSALLWGKRRFDLVVVDAPYGIVHGSDTGGGRRQRSAVELLDEAIGVWARQLKHGGALGLAWNTYTATRQQLAQIAGTAGLEVLDGQAHQQLGHRVDASIHRDVLVALRP